MYYGIRRWFVALDRLLGWFFSFRSRWQGKFENEVGVLRPGYPSRAMGR